MHLTPHGCTAMLQRVLPYQQGQPEGLMKTNHFTHHCQAASLFGSPHDATAACARPLNPMPSTCSLLGCAPFSMPGTASGIRPEPVTHSLIHQIKATFPHAHCTALTP